MTRTDSCDMLVLRVLQNGAAGISDEAGSKMRTIQEDSVNENGTIALGKSGQETSEVIADLLDLEFELNSIQQGLHQMEGITPSDPFGPSAAKEDPFGSDPFGDSFTPDTMFPPPKSTKSTAVTILPPPPSLKDTSRSSDPFNVPHPTRHPHRRNVARSERYSSDTVKPPPATPAQLTAAPIVEQEKHWFDQETESLFDEGELITPPMAAATMVTAITTSTVTATTLKTDQVLRTVWFAL